jgi:hypothetical protein
MVEDAIEPMRGHASGRFIFLRTRTKAEDGMIFQMNRRLIPDKVQIQRKPLRHC